MDKLRSDGIELPAEDEPMIYDRFTIEKSWGWVFFWGSRLWDETQDITYALAGNAPLLVEKQSGRILPLGTAQDADHYIERFEKTGDPFG